MFVTAIIKLFFLNIVTDKSVILLCYSDILMNVYAFLDADASFYPSMLLFCNVVNKEFKKNICIC